MVCLVTFVFLQEHPNNNLISTGFGSLGKQINAIKIHFKTKEPFITISIGNYPIQPTLLKVLIKIIVSSGI